MIAKWKCRLNSSTVNLHLTIRNESAYEEIKIAKWKCELNSGTVNLHLTIRNESAYKEISVKLLKLTLYKLKSQSKIIARHCLLKQMKVKRND